MELNHFNKHKSISDTSYAWRYINYFKLHDILFNRNIFFTRLDNFDDPLEGMNMKDRLSLHLKNLNKNKIYRDETEAFLSNINISKNKIEKWQKGIFSSCWFLTEKKHSESHAMWSLYSDHNGFAIKMPIKILNELINSSLENLSEFKIVGADYGKIEYLEYHEQPEENHSNLIMPALVKHTSYAHENELRYLLRWNSDINHNLGGINLKLSNKFNEAKEHFEIIAHPNMDDGLFNLYSNKLKEINMQLNKSSLFTRELVSKLIK